MSFEIENSLTLSPKHHLKPFRLGNVVKPGEKEGPIPIKLKMTVFVEQPLALLRFVKRMYLQKNSIINLIYFDDTN